MGSAGLVKWAEPFLGYKLVEAWLGDSLKQVEPQS